MAYTMEALFNPGWSIFALGYGRIGENIIGCVMREQETTEKEEKTKSRIVIPLDWVKRCRKGESQAMEAIYEQLKSSFYSLAYRYTYNSAVAEDLLQDIFVKIFTNIQALDKDEAFTGWAYRIAVNTCLSYLRHKSALLKKTVPFEETTGVVGAKTDTGHEKMTKRPLDEAIQSLSNKLKSVFVLHDIQGFKHEEIAQVLGCSVGTSKSQLFKARMKIRKQLLDKQVI